MKLFLCKTQYGVKKMTLNKVIKSKRRGKPVRIIRVADTKEKGV